MDLISVAFLLLGQLHCLFMDSQKLASFPCRCRRLAIS